VDGKKFQIRTSKKIQDKFDIRWSIKGGGWFTVTLAKINSRHCKDGYLFNGSEGFLGRAGVLTFLKTTTQLQVWFEDVLVVTWVYEDNADGKKCSMRGMMTGLKFRTPSKNDKVSTAYRYEKGNIYIFHKMNPGRGNDFYYFHRNIYILFVINPLVPNVDMVKSMQCAKMKFQLIRIFTNMQGC
jgi:hypothetical protein